MNIGLMSNEQQRERLNYLSIQLHLKLSKIVVILGIIFFVIYCIVQFTLIFSLLSNLTKSEFSYLKSIGTGWTLEQQGKRGNLMSFLDSTSKILKSVTYDANGVCNQTYYLCNQSHAKNYGPFDAVMKYLRANSQMLQANNILAISLLNKRSQIFLNLAQLGIKPNNVLNLSQIVSITKTDIKDISATSYYLKQTKISKNAVYVLCSNMELSYPMAICITSFVSLSSTIGPTSNFYIAYNPATRNSISKNEIQPIVAQNLNDISSDQIQDITKCIQNYPFMQSKYLKTISALQIKCKHDSSRCLNWFGPISTILSYQFSLDLESGLKRHYYIFQTGDISTDRQIDEASDITDGVYNMSINFIISSNSTFYHRQAAIVKQSLTNIRQSGYLLLSTLAVCVFIVYYSNYIFQDIFLKSIDMISRVLESLKKKEEKDFNQHLLRGHPQILGFIITYFHKFMWMHKLRKFKGKYKYRKLLLQGLQIFQQQKYVPVLKFIYVQLITLESQLVTRLFKIKQLPHKRRQMEEQQQRINKLIILNQQKVTKRRNANINLVDPDHDQLMKNISVSYRGNRGVRFSNDIQTIQIDEGPILRKVKFAQRPTVSCQTIKNDLSEAQNMQESIKRSDLNKESLKSLKSEQESFTSLLDTGRGIKKKESSSKTRSLESIHVDLDNLKLDEELDDDEVVMDQQSQQDQIYNMNGEQITTMISQTYQTVIDYYQKLLDLLASKMENQVQQQIPELANYIYILTIRKYEKVHQLLLYESQNEMERERQVIDFQDFNHLQSNYNRYLSNQLTQKAEVLRECILQALHSPISLSTLHDLYCKSNIQKIRIASRHLLARAAEELQPHLDLVVARNVYANLKEEKTTSKVKQESLNIFMRNLERYTNFWEELQELKMATQFYNTKNKKFYFLVSISTIKTFTPVLSKFYDLLDNFDIFNIYNLQEETAQTNQAETSENIVMRTKRRCMSDKLKYLMDLQGFIEQFNYSCEKTKQHDRTNSVKTIVKKRIYEKQFHEILLTIQDDQVDYSKYVVIFLGDQHNSADTEESSNSANHRPYQQRIHLQITKIIQMGYLHFILVGFSLDVYPSKYGRLKRYVKLSPELFEVELSAKQQQENLRRLEKYLR